MMMSMYRVIIKTDQDTSIRIAGSIVPNLDNLHLKSITVERTDWILSEGDR